MYHTRKQRQQLAQHRIVLVEKRCVRLAKFGIHIPYSFSYTYVNAVRRYISNIHFSTAWVERAISIIHYTVHAHRSVTGNDKIGSRFRAHTFGQSSAFGLNEMCMGIEWRARCIGTGTGCVDFHFSMYLPVKRARIQPSKQNKNLCGARLWCGFRRNIMSPGPRWTRKRTKDIIIIIIFGPSFGRKFWKLKLAANLAGRRWLA